MVATGRTPDLPVVLDAYRHIDREPDDVLVLLRPTAPFRRPDEIRAVVDLLRSSGADSVRSVVPAHEHPQKMYVETGRSGDWPLLAPATDRHRANHPRQWLPPAWRPCGFIDAVRADVLLGLDSLEGDRILGWPAPIGRASIEMDDEGHFLWAEAIAHEQQWKPGEIDT
jgi:N-acylneuraminate cytidylyltransferase